MNDRTISNSEMSASALEVLAIVQASEVFRPMVENHSDLRALLIRAAEVAARATADRERFIEAVIRATSATDKACEATRSGNDVDLAKWTPIAHRASEELGQILKQLCPDARPLGGDASATPAN
jgi:hypothetical protein